MRVYLAAIAAFLAAVLLLAGCGGSTSPVPVAAQYVKDIAKANGIVIEGDKIQAVRESGNSAIVLILTRFHPVLFGFSGPTQLVNLRVRLVRSGDSWSVTTLDNAPLPKTA